MLADIAHRQGRSHWRELYQPQAAEVAHALEMVQAAQTTVLPFASQHQVVTTDTWTSRWIATACMWGADDLPALAAIYDLLPPPTVSIHLEISPDLAFDRIRNRPKGDHATKLNNPKRLATYHESFAEIRPLVPYQRVTIDASEPLPTTIAKVIAIVEDRLTPPA